MVEPKHLTIISYPRELDSFLESVAFVAKPDDERREFFARCQTGLQLDHCVMNAGRNVTRLDLVGHGSTIDFEMGDEDVLASGQEAHPVFAMLHHRLPLNAEVRILGCLTGITESGRDMLRSVARALHGRKVFGTTRELYPEDFGENGLLPCVADEHLVEAQDAVREEPTRRTGPVSPKDLDAARAWSEDFPGYQALGRGRPLTRIDFRCPYKGANVSVACNGWLLQLEDDAEQAPLLMRWSNSASVPLVQRLVEARSRAG